MIRFMSITFLLLFLDTTPLYADWKIGTKIKCGIPNIRGIGNLNQGIASDVNLCACSGNHCKWVRIDADSVFKLIEYLKDNKKPDNKIVNQKVLGIGTQIENALAQ